MRKRLGTTTGVLLAIALVFVFAAALLVIGDRSGDSARFATQTPEQLAQDDEPSPEGERRSVIEGNGYSFKAPLDWYEQRSEFRRLYAPTDTGLRHLSSDVVTNTESISVVVRPLAKRYSLAEFDAGLGQFISYIYPVTRRDGRTTLGEEPALRYRSENVGIGRPPRVIHLAAMRGERYVTISFAFVRRTTSAEAEKVINAVRRTWRWTEPQPFRKAVKDETRRFSGAPLRN